MTPEDLRSGAKFILQEGQTIESALKALESKINEVTAAWEGTAQLCGRI